MNKVSLSVLVGVVAIASGGLIWKASLHSALANSKPSEMAAKPIVEAVRVTRGDLIHKLEANATLEAFEAADLYPKVSGYLSTVNVDIGDHVKSGQVLAVISLPEVDHELAEAKAQLDARNAELALQRLTVARDQELYNEHGITDQAFDEAKSKTAIAEAQINVTAAAIEKLKTTIAYTKIVAPFDGVVTQRLVNRGDFVQSAASGRTTPLFSVQKLDKIRVFFDVPENDVSHVKVGNLAQIMPFGLEGKVLTGKVTRDAQRLDTETRHMKTEVDLPNTNEMLYPGMYAQVVLETGRTKDVLLLPASAIKSSSNGSSVFLIQNGRVNRRAIKTGDSTADTVEIVSGLSEGDQIVKNAKKAPQEGAYVQMAAAADGQKK